MKCDPYGRAHYSSDELCDLLYKQPDLDLSKFLVDDAQQYNKSNKQLYANFPHLTQFEAIDLSGVKEFDEISQSNWYMPDEYKNLDIAQWVLLQCHSEHELQRVGQELLLYQERDLFNLLRFLKYLVDTLRKNNIVWGVGRGSSVASYVLYLIGVHRINSIFYDLDIKEFLK